MNTLSTRTLLGTGVLAVALTGLVACGGSDKSSGDKTSDGTGSSSSSSSGDDASAAAKNACAVTTKDTVQKVTGGTVADGKPGAARNCTYTVTGGSVPSIDVYLFGTSADFAAIKSGYDSNRGGTEDISGIGDAAYAPKDVGENEIVARAGNTVFAVGLGTLSTGKVSPVVKELAAAIAAELG